MSTRIETVTILFTDLVGSTELLQRVGDEHAQRIFKAHHRVLSYAARSHGGHEVKWLGDGLMVAFPSALQALRCAVAMQREARRPTSGERLQIRAGLNVGETIRDETDYFGTPVVVARRLCDRADAGRIYASETVVRMLDGHPEFIYEPLGELALKGITRPVSCFDVLYEHDPLALLRNTPFVGRTREVAALDKTLARAQEGRGSVVMLAGEPGIGKTRLAEEFCTHAEATGVAIARGACYEGDISAPYRPWTEALRAYAEARPDDDLRREMGAGAPEILLLLPELRSRFPDIEQATRLEPELARPRLFDSLTQFVRAAAVTRPLLLFLDDLHWADRPSLALLQQVARNTTTSRLILLGAYRDVELDRKHPLSETLGTLARLDEYEHAVLHGLPEETITELLAVLEPSEEAAVARGELTTVLHHETEGNPFFIRELLTHLIETGKIVLEGGRWIGGVKGVDELDIPDGAREVIGRRLARLSDGCNDMLNRVSLMTSGCAWGELRAINASGGGGAFSDATLLDHLDEALRAHVLVERRAQSGLAYSFAHALIRQTLYQELSLVRRSFMHREVGEALERLYGEDSGPHVAELSYHFFSAIDGGDAGKAADYCERAGERAMALSAWEEAATHYQRALRAAERQPPSESGQHCDLLLKLGAAQTYSAQIEQAVETYRLATETARQAGDAACLAQAAVGFEDASYAIFGEVGLRREALALLDEALDVLGDAHPRLRVRALIARIRPAGAIGLGDDVLYSSGFGSHAMTQDPALKQQAREAVALAEELNDPELLAGAMSILLEVGLRTGDSARDLPEALAQVRRSQECGAVSLELWGRTVVLSGYLELGDMPAWRSELAEYVRRAHEIRLPVHIATTEAIGIVSLMAEGRLAEAEPLVFDCFRRRQEAGAPNAVTTFGAQLYALRWLQGRPGELESLFRDTADASPNIPAYRVALALIHCANSDAALAQREIELVSSGDPMNVSDDPLWIVTMALWAEVCAETDDKPRAQAIYTMLQPHAHLNVVVRQMVSLGSAERTLGRLAYTLGQWDNAERHFQRALDVNARWEQLPWLTMTKANYAELLLARGAPGDREHMHALLEDALVQARNLGMTRVIADCEKLALLDDRAIPDGAG